MSSTDQRVIDNLIQLNETLKNISKELKRIADIKEATARI